MLSNQIEGVGKAAYVHADFSWPTLPSLASAFEIRYASQLHSF